MFTLADIVDLVLEAWDDPHLTEHQLPALMQMLAVCREKQKTQPQPVQYVQQPQQTYPQPPFNPGLSTQPQVDRVQAAREAQPGNPDFILDPTNPNSKAMRGRVKNLAQVKRKKFEDGEIDHSGGGFDLDE